MNPSNTTLLDPAMMFPLVATVPAVTTPLVEKLPVVCDMLTGPTPTSPLTVRAAGVASVPIVTAFSAAKVSLSVTACCASKHRVGMHHQHPIHHQP